MTKYDAVIIGARAAGSPTAMLLARKGFKVALIDRDDFPSDTISTHMIHVQGVAAMNRWGILDAFDTGDTPKLRQMSFAMGPISVTGNVPSHEGLDYFIAPRRYLFDKHLVDSAVEAGAELYTGINIRELVTEDGVVTGVTGYDRDGIPVQFDATVVIGADGMNSRIARLVDAKEYRNQPSLTACYIAYWTGTGITEPMVYFRDGNCIGIIPTNQGQVVIWVQFPRERMDTFKKDIEGNYHRALDLVPGLGEQVRSGTRVERFVGTGDVRGFFRQPYGPGWALVGDAGYHKDPTLGHGIMDAFFQAEILVEALSDVFSGRQDFETAMAVFQQQRDFHHSDDYDFVTSLSYLDKEHSADEIALLLALSQDQDAADQYISVISGIMPISEFFAPENLGRIMARNSLAAAA